MFRQNSTQNGEKFRFNSARVQQASTILSKAKKDSYIIAKNPEKFLSNGKSHISFDTGTMEKFINSIACGSGDGHDGITSSVEIERNKKLQEIQKKKESLKNRAFLLNLQSIKSKSNLCKNGNGDGNLQNFGQNQLEIEEIIEDHLRQIKEADTEDIENWLQAEFELKFLKLPFGLPKGLKFPLDPSNLPLELKNFAESSMDQYLLLDGAYSQKVEEILEKLGQNQTELLGPENSWSLRETALLFNIQSTLEESTAPTSPQILSEILKRIFEGKTREAIVHQKYKLKSKRNLEEKLANLCRDWERDKNELKISINKAWIEMNRSRVDKMVRVQNVQKQKNLCQFWSQMLEDKRRERCERMQNFKIQVEPFYKQKAMEDRERFEKEMERKEQLKEELRKFKSVQEEEKQKNSDLNVKIWNEFESKVVKMQNEKNKERVEYRKSAFECKRKNLELRKIAESKSREMKAKILEKSKEKVDIPYDPISIYNDTHTSKVRRWETLSSNPQRKEETDIIKFFRDRYSFTSEQIVRDRRVKLEVKLREAGLLNTSYARQVLMSLEPQPKPHLNSAQLKSAFETN